MKGLPLCWVLLRQIGEAGREFHYSQAHDPGRPAGDARLSWASPPDQSHRIARPQTKSQIEARRIWCSRSRRSWSDITR